jgi:cyclohexanone monooxygenase
MEYSYQFSEELQQEWSWSERYAPQPEILEYANHVADRFDLRRDIQFDTRVEAAHYDEAARRWTVRTSDGGEVTARFCVMATGCLSSTNLPDFHGRERFRGATYHTGMWPHEDVDFTGLRVGVIGTGSSAVQSIPVIAKQASHLYVFQRTPNYSIPARNGPMDREYEREIKAHYREFRERNAKNPSGLSFAMNDGSALAVPEDQLEREFRERWERGGLSFLRGYKDLLQKREANAIAAEFVRDRIRETVRDPAVAELLSPKQVIGCKRLCLDSGYYETFNRDNVTLVDISSAPIEEITATGLRIKSGTYELHAIVFATGFDAMTGTLTRMDIRGRNGVTLRGKWSAGPRTYLGLSTVGFPNLFMITGPGSPSVLSNMISAIEQHVNWISGCMDHMRARKQETVEAQPAAEDAWVEHVNAVAGRTLYPHCNSWYLGANVPGKPRVFMPYIGFPEYVARCKEIVARDYEGFTFA